MAWRNTLGPNQLKVVTFQLKIIGPERRRRPRGSDLLHP